MRRLTFPRILIVFYGVAVAAALLIYFLTGRNLPIRKTILILTFLFLLLYRIHFFLSPQSAAEQSPEPNTRTRRINPRLGWLGLLGLLGILGFFTGEGFLFLFFWFFGFFGFFYEGKLSNTLRDERFILNQQRACSAACQLGLSLISLSAIFACYIDDPLLSRSFLMAMLGLSLAATSFLQPYLLYRYDQLED